jgi:hypothetical protein
MRAIGMKTVRDIFTSDVLPLKVQGVGPFVIKDRVIDIGHDAGFSHISERTSGGGDQLTKIELIFPNGEAIWFDGTDWHHQRGP